MTALPLSAFAAAFDKARQIIRSFPPLPSSIRYLDEYEDEWRSVRGPEIAQQWHLRADTDTLCIDFGAYDPDEAQLLKHFFCWMLSKRSVLTIANTYWGLKRLGERSDEHWLLEAVQRPQGEWNTFWAAFAASSAQDPEAYFLKALLHFMCEMSIGDFTPESVPFVKSLPFAWQDHYVGVLTGESVISLTQEKAIIGHLDAVASQVQGSPDQVSDATLTAATLLCISYEHGLRPIQICRIPQGDLRFYRGEDGSLTAHFTAYRAKKVKSSEKTPFTRRIKADWVPIFVEYARRRERGPVWRVFRGSERKLFTLSKSNIISAIGDVVESITGLRSCATKLRHSAAQRMADGGASAEDIANFLGHSNINMCLVYFETSPGQGQRFNNALAVSPTYRRIAEIARAGVIDKPSLSGLPSDNQVAGLPHGIPVSGIGACMIGQSLCAKNPVLSCYGCKRFIPLNEVAVHRQALFDLRSVVKFFFDEARKGTQSEAYAQLCEVLEDIQTVIALLEHRPDAERHE